jgi:hypothetical protein
MFVQRKVIGVILGILAMATLRAQIGCMDTSKHRDTSDGYDYKKLHYVACACPCQANKTLNKKGRCNRCLHFHKPQDIYQF